MQVTMRHRGLIPSTRAGFRSARVRNGATVSNVTSHARVIPGRALSVDYEDDVDVSVMDSYDGASCVVTDSQVVDRVTVGQVLRDQIATMGGEQLMDPQDFVSTDAQRAQCAVLFGSCALLATKGLWIFGQDGFSTAETVMTLVTVGLAYWTSDLGTGIFHWSVDNYGSKKTPLLGGVIDAFQGHHKYPWTITKRQWANNIHTTCIAPLVFTTPTLFFNERATDLIFVGVFTSLIVLSQQFHAWSHMKKSELPSTVLKAQDMGLLIGRRDHGQHHKSPFASNYSIVSGWWNPILDGNGFYRKLEQVIYDTTGVPPRCWSDDVEFVVQESAPEGWGKGILGPK
jgi:hypothetical protein